MKFEDKFYDYADTENLTFESLEEFIEHAQEKDNGIIEVCVWERVKVDNETIFDNIIEYLEENYGSPDGDEQGVETYTNIKEHIFKGLERYVPWVCEIKKRFNYDLDKKEIV